MNSPRAHEPEKCHSKGQDKIHVVCAVIISPRGILIAQRPAHKHLGGCWEFPGGKIEPGETAENALAREIKEELNCEIEVLQNGPTIDWKYERGIISMKAFLCRLKALSPEPVAIEHSELRWANITEFDQINLAPADKPLIAWIREWQNRSIEGQKTKTTE